MIKSLTRVLHTPRLGLILLIFAAFVALGMPDGLLGVAWPSIRLDFNVPLDAVGLLLFMSTTGYLTSSFFSGKLIAALGVGRVLLGSCLLTGAGLMGYTLMPQWWMMALLGIAAGLGAGAIDAGLNTYVAAHFGEGMMQWLHASYGVGITLGPIIMTASLTSLNAWRPGYLAVGGFQLLMAACFLLTLPLWNTHTVSSAAGQPRLLTDYKTSLPGTLRQPRVWLSMLLFFFYTGTEVALGTWSYTLLTEGRGIAPQTAGLWTGSYWAAFTLGRILAGLFARRIGVNSMVFGGLAGALAGSLLLWWNPADWTNLLAVALIGFSVAPIFPALVSGTSQRVGLPFAANTIGMQITAAGLGGALIPSLVGVLARQFAVDIIPLCLTVLFLVLLGLHTTARKPA
ncbi:MAG: MFS transporter [Bellilinea sp.]